LGKVVVPDFSSAIPNANSTPPNSNSDFAVIAYFLNFINHQTQIIYEKDYALSFVPGRSGSDVFGEN
jgi:hypothetical protein